MVFPVIYEEKERRYYGRRVDQVRHEDRLREEEKKKSYNAEREEQRRAKEAKERWEQEENQRWTQLNNKRNRSQMDETIIDCDLNPNHVSMSLEGNIAGEPALTSTRELRSASYADSDTLSLAEEILMPEPFFADTLDQINHEEDLTSGSGSTENSSILYSKTRLASNTESNFKTPSSAMSSRKTGTVTARSRSTSLANQRSASRSSRTDLTQPGLSKTLKSKVLHKNEGKDEVFQTPKQPQNKKPKKGSNSGSGGRKSNKKGKTFL